MTYKQFLNTVIAAAQDYGMPCGCGDEGGIEIVPLEEDESCQDVWFVCPDCGDSIYFCDWCDEDVEDMTCPICEYQL